MPHTTAADELAALIAHPTGRPYRGPLEPPTCTCRSYDCGTCMRLTPVYRTP